MLFILLFFTWEKINKTEVIEKKNILNNNNKHSLTSEI